MLGRGAGAADFKAGCLESLEKLTRNDFPATFDEVEALKKFAEDNHLPYKVLELGPPQRRVQRIFVGIDVTNAPILQAYRNQFALDQKVGDNAVGTLALEFQYEDAGKYVTGVLRTDGDPKVNIWRWGKQHGSQQDLTLDSWWNNWILSRNYYAGQPVQPALNYPILAFAHLLGLTEPERENVHYYLEHPEARGACKDSNCVAWTTGIELKKTRPGVSDEERGYLFNVLEVARSMAHFEIGRRLMNAANQRHGAVVVFLNGADGVKAFNDDLPKYLPPDPQIPYINILRGVKGLTQKVVLDAVKTIPDGARVFIPIGAGASPEGFTGLIEYAQGLQKGITVDTLVNGLSEAALKDASKMLGDKLHLNALFLGSNLRSLYREGRVDVIPGYLSDFPRLLKEHANGDFKYDAILVRVSPPDPQGRYSLGPNNDLIMAVIQDNPGIKVIAEVNPNVPHASGNNYLTAQQITASFPSRSQLAGPPVVPLEEVEKNIGTNVASLVTPGAVLQIGIGNLFDGIPDGLQKGNKNGLRIHSEMFGDALRRIVDLNLVQPGQDMATTSFVYGSAELYAWLNNNPRVTVAPTSEVNDPAKIASMPNFHAVNTALQVSLRGDANATMAPDGVRMSSPGGQVDFMSGAIHSPGGKSIIAIRATAKGATLSTIVMDLYPGPVTTPHELVTHVVTEYGVAELHGKSESQRALALIQIAHPKFRPQLAKEALARHLITQAQAASLNLGL